MSRFSLVPSKQVWSLPTSVEIFHKSVRVASHIRAHGRGQVVTNPERRLKSHQAHLEWTPLRMVNWARTIGPKTAACSSGFWSTGPIQRWGIELVWASPGWPTHTPRHGWNQQPRGVGYRRRSISIAGGKDGSSDHGRVGRRAAAEDWKRFRQ